jgi:hypothetical protein
MEDDEGEDARLVSRLVASYLCELGRELSMLNLVETLTDPDCL